MLLAELCNGEIHMVNFNLQSTFCEQALKEKYHVNIDGKAFNNDDDVDNVDG